MGSTNDFEGCINHGPWGSTGPHGNKWVYMPRGIIEKMTIVVRHKKFIYSMAFQTYNSKGEGRVSEFGGNGGEPTETICVLDSNEYLMSIWGTHDKIFVYSICFETNMNNYGPYGSHGDTFFSYDIKDGEVVGFYGWAGSCLNAIGVYVKPRSLELGPEFMHEGKVVDELCSSMSMMTMSRDAGPWGPGGGKAWDDGVIFFTIKHVHVHLGAMKAIYALQFEYQESDGKSVLSQIHGGSDGSETQMVSLNDKDEYLIGVSGFYGPVKGYDGMEAIASISFHTNKRTHGAFGEERGAGYVYFSSASSSGKIVGFHGRSNGFISAIGVHMKYF